MSGIIEFPRRKQAESIETIMQAELMEVEVLRRKMLLYRAMWEKKKKTIIQRMLDGAQVEPGIFHANLDVRV